MTTRNALALAFLLVASGAAIGVAAARLPLRPAATDAPRQTAAASAAPALPPIVDGTALVFGQPLSAGCATDDAVWVVSDGGGVARFADDRWALVDGTLRTLTAASCGRGEMIAVGPGGRILVADDRSRTIAADGVGTEDLLGVAALGDGSAVAVGTRGTVLRRGSGWGAFATGIEENLRGVALLSPASAWAVGDEGAAYRLEERGWRALPTGLVPTLRAVAAVSADDALAVGDDGLLLRWRGAWTRLASGVTTSLRGVARVGDIAFVTGDAGLALRIDLRTEKVERIDLATACPVRGVFVRAGEPWFIASQGIRAAVWRGGATLQRWGAC